MVARFWNDFAFWFGRSVVIAGANPYGMPHSSVCDFGELRRGDEIGFALLTENVTNERGEWIPLREDGCLLTHNP
jgi:hypothetical protein